MHVFKPSEICRPFKLDLWFSLIIFFGGQHKIKFDLNRHESKKFYTKYKMSQHQSTHKNGIEIFVEKTFSC